MMIGSAKFPRNKTVFINNNHFENKKNTAQTLIVTLIQGEAKQFPEKQRPEFTE